MGAGTGAQNGGSGSGVISGGTTLTARTRGGFGGDERLATHNHTATDSGHNHAFLRVNGNQQMYLANAAAGGGVFGLSSGVGSILDVPNSTANITVQNNVGGGSGGNMPPFLVTNYIIKAIADIARGGWYTQSSPPVVTQLPTNPAIGEEVYLYASTGGILYRRWDGTRWQSVGSGWQKIGDFTLSGTTLSYSSIPQTYTHLQVRFIMASSRAGFQNTGGRYRWNGVSSSYSISYRTSTGTTTYTGASNTTDTSAYLGQIPSGSRASANCIARGIIDFPHYNQTYMIKTGLCSMHGWDGYNSSSGYITGTTSANVDAITSITLLDDAGTNLTVESAAELWGCA